MFDVIDASMSVGCCFSPRSSLVSTSNRRGDGYPEQRFMSIEADDSCQYRAGRWAYSKVLNTRTDHEDCTTNEVRRVVEGCTTPVDIRLQVYKRKSHRP